MMVMEVASNERRRAMSSTVFNVRAWGRSRPRLPRSVGQIRSARNLSVEQVAPMVAAWGRMEVRYAGDDRAWIVWSP
jgi:hypothetical protein